MINKGDALRLHLLAIKKYGGLLGLRDEGALLSALAKPFQTFDSEELYDSFLRK